ncbi:PD40 domain-containing protein [Kribbella hippodromi]|uniref:PD40 domain-containing protein n=1 Tax=Kribbella hippodromi TaxID=434347 RepID=A0ABP4QBE4_9ACTN
MTNFRGLTPGQRSQVWVGGPELAEPELVFESGELLVEAPNWSLDGAALLVNGDGELWRLTLDDTTLTKPAPGDAGPQPALARVPFDGLPGINNDHVLDPDGQHIYLSAMDRHIYRGSLDGGAVQRVTPDDGKWHFLHGVSPDGSQLAYVEIGNFPEPGRLAVLTQSAEPVIVDTGTAHIDGPEWSPDGKWIYFNTEGFTDVPGHAQLARTPADGGADSGGSGGGATVEQVVVSETVDWFPHLSPDGQYATYITFPPGTLGHPADLDVEVRVVSTTDWSVPLQRYQVFGGQGTLNVNSWSPDSTRFAFVAYPMDAR